MNANERESKELGAAIKFLLLILCLAYLLAMTAPAMASTNAPKKLVVIVGIDDTGSYDNHKKAISIVQRIIAQLPPGAVLYARRITDSSYSDRCNIERIEIPTMPAKPSNNLDRRARFRYQAALQKVKAVKLWAMSKLARLEPSRAKKTDIWGFICAAAERFKLEAESGAEKLMIICSDMSDNTGRKIRPKLTGVKVWVVGWQAGDDPAKAIRLKKYWSKQLTNHCNGLLLKFLPLEIKVRLRP